MASVRTVDPAETVVSGRRVRTVRSRARVAFAGKEIIELGGKTENYHVATKTEPNKRGTRGAASSNVEGNGWCGPTCEGLPLHGNDGDRGDRGESGGSGEFGVFSSSASSVITWKGRPKSALFQQRQSPGKAGKRVLYSSSANHLERPAKGCFVKNLHTKEECPRVQNQIKSIAFASW